MKWKMLRFAYCDNGIYGVILMVNLVTIHEDLTKSRTDKWRKTYELVDLTLKFECDIELGT